MENEENLFDLRAMEMISKEMLLDTCVDGHEDQTRLLKETSYLYFENIMPRKPVDLDAVSKEHMDNLLKLHDLQIQLNEIKTGVTYPITSSFLKPTLVIDNQIEEKSELENYVFFKASEELDTSNIGVTVALNIATGVMRIMHFE